MLATTVSLDQDSADATAAGTTLLFGEVPVNDRYHLGLDRGRRTVRPRCGAEPHDYGEFEKVQPRFVVQRWMRNHSAFAFAQIGGSVVKLTLGYGVWE